MRNRSCYDNFWVLPKCILQKYWWDCKVWHTMRCLMQRCLLLQNTLSPMKIFNFLKVNAGPSQSCRVEIPTVPKGCSLLMGCMWENVAELECGDWSPFILWGVFLWALIRFDRLQCSVYALFKKELIARNNKELEVGDPVEQLSLSCNPSVLNDSRW